MQVSLVLISVGFLTLKQSVTEIPYFYPSKSTKFFFKQSHNIDIVFNFFIFLKCEIACFKVISLFKIILLGKVSNFIQ